MSVKNLPIPYALTILIGFLVGVLFALKTYLMYLYWDEMQYYAFERHALVPVVNYTLWGILMPLVYYFIQRYRVGKSYPLRENLLAILISLFFALFHEVTSNVLYFAPLHFLGIRSFSPETMEHISKSFASAAVSRLIEYWILYAVVTGLEFQRKFRDKQIELAQMQNQLSNARLNALRLQLQPHFLFNTLNTISSLMEVNVKDAQRIVSKLGNLLRSVLDQDKSDEVELQEELQFIRSYLGIEQIRFQDRLNIRYRIEEPARRCRVPSLILQPLVENAVKHGFARQTGQGSIEVLAVLTAGRLQLTVRDNGRGSADATREILSGGQGLSNVQKRLELIYKDDYLIHIDTAPGEGFSISLDIPCRQEQRKP